jgi:hypothetical protein
MVLTFIIPGIVDIKLLFGDELAFSAEDLHVKRVTPGIETY